MNAKITTLKKASQQYKPNSITLMSGSFEPFSEYYFRLLEWAAKQNRPLVVIVQKDDMVLRRRGFLPLASTHKTRAGIIAALEFVDSTIVANKTAHDRECISLLQPKVIAFQNDNLKYRETLAREIRKRYPRVHIAYAPFRSSRVTAPSDGRIAAPMDTKDEISRVLLRLSARSKGRLSKLSALLLDSSGTIVLQAANSSDEEHAEILLIREAEGKHIKFSGTIMYTLIPPCLMCAKEIWKHGVQRVFYLLSYGEGQGVQYLRDRGSVVRQYKPSELITSTHQPERVTH